MQRRAPLTALLAGALVACGGSQEKVSVETRDAPAPDVAANVKTAPAPTETPQVAPEGAPRGFEFNRDGAAARYTVPAANQATLNHIQGFDYAVVIA
ncbi:MAG: hypothetical protein KC636_26140, partial [Myxococcales bacterium]|nr:hypothetical protein [Myxococcales bacterium]